MVATNGLKASAIVFVFQLHLRRGDLNMPLGLRVHSQTAITAGQGAVSQNVIGVQFHHFAECFHGFLMFLLGGRAAEKLVFDEFSAGAEDDLKRATSLARRMVTHWGMSERIGPMAFRHGEEHPFLGKEMAEPREYSEHTAQIIDEEIARILREAETQAESRLMEHRQKLDLLAAALEKEETLDETQLEELLGPPVYRSGESSEVVENRPKPLSQPTKARQPTEKGEPIQDALAPPVWDSAGSPSPDGQPAASPQAVPPAQAAESQKTLS